ncbi:AIPR family protein [Gordonia sp. SCSIO 19800]|uniref:AIPR family protein n=1 Tax=Gordonia sp. SCSIO 19800 TaxID=2826926 RepID=UPI001B842C16|nr:AIPR family protein [Gordonia sp. SCSIO 19800]MBR7193517.1 AIPR family protein [Gordonia sp. SCSIO 19800]
MSIEALRAFASRDDLAQFHPNGLLLYALELRFDLEDVAAIAATSITDGKGDRKCDLVYIDAETSVAVLGQGYLAADASKPEAPSNKAADLGIAASWVLGNERPADLSSGLRTAATELHEAIERGEVDSIELWYSHNLSESRNVDDELERAARTANAILAQQYPDRTVDVRYLQVGKDTLNDWYASKKNPILVSDEINVPTRDWFTEEGDEWSAVCTSVPATWLHGLYEEHLDRLFSANVRGYMPRRRSAQNINFGIEQTARDEPGRFWAFNNGVTALVNSFDSDKRTGKLKLYGIAVVNGAQTTGSLGRVDKERLGDAKVMIRFVQSSNQRLVEDIIRYNNSQNQIKPSDFRSGDRIQTRLREEFKSIPDSLYLGARRGGSDDRARKPSNLVPSDTAAQAIAAFHQDPTTAYHDLASIWNRDHVYAKFFSDHTSAEHIVFCYSLWRAVAARKAELSALDTEEQTSDDRDALDYLRRRGSLYLLVAAIANSAETYIGRAIPNAFALSFGRKVSPATATDYWMPLVDALLPFASSQLGPAFDDGGVRRRETVRSHVATFRSIVASTKRANSMVFSEFAEKVAPF